MPTAPSAPVLLPTIQEQCDQLVRLGVAKLADLSAGFGSLLPHDTAGDGALLVVHPSLVPPSRLITALRVHDRQGFVVDDMDDVDDFRPVPGVDVPDAPLYTVTGLDRGDDMANWSPEEASAELTTRGRSPLTITEGISWLLQAPSVLERSRCFMTIACRKTKLGGGPDARVPALWFSNGTGRDGKDRKGNPKLGWCWFRNRHTWLGFASCSSRHAPS